LQCSPQEIPMLERAIDFPEIVQSKEPSLSIVRRDNFAQLLAFTLKVAENYLTVCYPNQKSIAPVIAADLIETRPTWNTMDLINLFKFLRQRQDLESIRVYGNQITIPKFMERVSVYEDFRAQALEEERIKGKDKRIMFSEVDEANRERTDKFMEVLNAKLEAKKLPENPIYPDENIFQK